MIIELRLWIKYNDERDDLFDTGTSDKNEDNQNTLGILLV